jgi:hypothetical protein
MQLLSFVIPWFHWAIIVFKPCGRSLCFALSLLVVHVGIVAIIAVFVNVVLTRTVVCAQAADLVRGDETDAGRFCTGGTHTKSKYYPTM